MALESLIPDSRLLITILVRTEIKFKVAENEQLTYWETGYLSMMMLMLIIASGDNRCPVCLILVT
jgi:hypothetical protein